MRVLTTITIVSRIKNIDDIGGGPVLSPPACCKKDDDCGAHCSEGAGICGIDCQCACKTMNGFRCQKDIDCNVKCSNEGYCKLG